MGHSTFKSKPTEKYLKAVDALNDLLSEENGGDSVHRAFAEVVQERWRDDYLAREKLKPAHGRHVCIHRLIGKRCPEDTARGTYADATCASHYIPRADHLSEWRAEDGKRYIVSQPYGRWDYNSLKELIAFCDRLGLEATIDASRSWHFPGWTMLVEIQRGEKVTP